MPKSSIARRSPSARRSPQDAEHGGVAHERGLGDLEHQAAGRQAGGRQRAGDVGDEVGAREVLRGEVDVHADVAPVAALRAGLAQDRAVELDDAAGLLGERDEVRRHDEAALGVLPARERLDGDDLAVSSATMGWYWTRSSPRSAACWRSSLSWWRRTTALCMCGS